MSRWVVMVDIVPPGWSTPFPRYRTFIDYDSKRPIAKKQHQIVYQQRDQYGTVGDMCAGLSHEQLLELERQGAVRRVK
jgi:hypothetical protein